MRRTAGLLLVIVVGMTAGARRAPATIAEQRARLPPPATCDDPVAGVWRSHNFHPLFADWSRFTVTIERVEGSDTKLVGKIENENWEGTASDQEPPKCDGRLHTLISMDAEGSIVDGVIDFHGVGEWRLDETLCGVMNIGYNLDRFTGKIDPDLQEFQSVNNDGGRSVNEATVFRRIECADGSNPEERAPAIHVKPPPFYPAEESGGGACGLR